MFHSECRVEHSVHIVTGVEQSKYSLRPKKDVILGILGQIIK
jgi:hypothetical protein